MNFLDPLPPPPTFCTLPTLSLVGDRHLQLVLTTYPLAGHCEIDNNFTIAIRKTPRRISSMVGTSYTTGSEITGMEYILPYIHLICQ